MEVATGDGCCSKRCPVGGTLALHQFSFPTTWLICYVIELHRKACYTENKPIWSLLQQWAQWWGVYTTEQTHILLVPPLSPQGLCTGLAYTVKSALNWGELTCESLGSRM